MRYNVSLKKHCTAYDTKGQFARINRLTTCLGDESMKVLQEDVFPHLVIGLTKFIESGQKYPYPHELHYALHHLSAAMLTKYPGTITDLLQLFEQPLEQWWP